MDYRREIFSWCGHLTSHYLVLSWLRPACSFLKRLASSNGAGWDSDVPSAVVLCCADFTDRLSAQDPSTGRWNVPTSPDSEWTLYCDASYVALGVVLEVNGTAVENACWLRQPGGKKHINVAELEAVVKGQNLAQQWKAQKVNIVTDSKSVYEWLTAVIGNTHRVKTGGLYAALVQRRLEIVLDFLPTMSLSVQWVPSKQNKAHVLSRVPATFLTVFKSFAKTSDVVSAAVPLRDSVISLADIAHH